MRPVYQTRVGKDGNCLEASLCSILDLPLSDCPDLGGDKEYLENLAKFLLPLGLYFIEIQPIDTTEEHVLTPMFKAGDVFHLIMGTSPRGGSHAVVGKNGKVVWDPHPEATTLSV